VQLVGDRIPLGMGGISARKGAAQVTGSEGVELVGEFVGTGAGLDHGQGPTGMADDVGVGGEIHVSVDRARLDRLPQRGGHGGVPDPAGASAPDEALLNSAPSRSANR